MNAETHIKPPAPMNLLSHLLHKTASLLLALLPAILFMFAVNNGWCDDKNNAPNIVFVLADDLGWGDLHCYGNEAMHTPHLDAFAKQGVRLTQCYSASAVCSPSRSAILTGRTPHRNGVYTWLSAGSEVHLRTSERTLPALLKAQGYTTCHVGKWHLNGKFNSPEQPQPNDHGYEWWLATQNNAAPSHKDPNNFVRNGEPVGKQEGYSAVLVVEEAVRWLKEKRDLTKPFLLSVCTHEPHLPIESDPEFQKHYASIADDDTRQHHGNVTQLDFAFGKLMATLDDLKLTQNTMVVFTADNGPEGNGLKGRTRGSTGGLRGRKRDLYEGGIRVAGMVRWPEHIQANTICNLPVIGSDWFPTILAATHTSVPNDRTLDGANVLPVLTGKESNIKRSVPMYWRLEMAPQGKHVAMRSGDWKLVSTSDLNTVELYNLAEDPHETKDLRETEPKVFQELIAQLKPLHASIEAEGPDWWKRLSSSGAMPPKNLSPKNKQKP
jgi:arylsulfatase A